MTKPGTSAITGIGQTAYSKQSGKTVLALCVEAGMAAIGDAGLEPADIDGLISFTFDTNDELELQQALGIPDLNWVGRLPFGGAGAFATFQMAAAAVESGAANHVLIYRSFNERSESRFGQPNAFAWMYGEGRDLNRSYGLSTPAQAYALQCRPYLDRFGVTSADLGRYVVQARAYAATNPQAWFYQRPLSLDEHQASRWIVEPVLRLLDCCQESDGGAAFVVSRLNHARTSGRPVIRILAAEQSWLRGAGILYDHQREDLTRLDSTERLAAKVWARTGLSPREVDVMMIYDAFSPNVLMKLEAFGFCGHGEAKELIASGGIGPGGTIPVNTNGGLLGEGYIHGMNNAIEAVRQLRGTAPNQIAGAGIALVANTNCAVLLARE
ncbi:lipid-transfer protein [Novosphingobium bradum]|uniref:Lipid-transfer protein n=1 Tax=Novosphingobium bradum TaxID=1737444 RepID=A0ABV7IKT3_9SPHN